MLGERLAHYRILERIGQGGMGEVYKAEDLKLLRLVALKVLRRGNGGTSDEAHARLQHEARAASALSHPNIATIYEIGEGERDGQRVSFIAMEYVPGRRLTEAAADSDGVPAIVALVKDVANALDEAHRSGVIHRDIKPSNVLVSNGGRVKVLDFGIAVYCPAADASRETWSGPLAGAKGPDGELLGTVSYMSPEQILGRDLDARTDVFSLGVMLYELLSGRLPFQGATVGATFDALLHGEPEPLPFVTPAVDAELWRVVKRMLEKERDRRYPSMREVELELCAVLRGDAASRSVAPGLAERSVAVMTFTNITGSPEDEWLATAISETVTADLKALGGVAVFGNERVHEVLRRLRSGRSGIDERLAIDVGREMGARWIVSGGFQRVGDQLRITARFLEVSSGEVLRTVKIDGATADLFALQDRIARELAHGLPALASPGAPAAETPEETTVLPAYEAFTKGVYNRRVAGRDSLERAILFFERAVALDPLYLRAQVALAMAYDDKGQDLSAPEPVEKAVAIFQKVLVRDPGRSEAWRGYASALGYLGRSAEALVAVQRALALRPEDARVRASHARILFLGYARFADAAAELEIALRINPQAGWAALQLVHCYTLLNDLGKAEEVARRAVALQRQLVSGKEGFLIVGSHTRLGHVLTLQGRFEAAEEEYQEELLFLTRVDHVLRERARIELDTRLGEVLLKTGREEDARLHFRRAVTSFEERLAMGADEPFTRYYVALALTHLGEKARAVEFLEEAARMRRLFTVARAALEAGFAGLRGDKGFEALLAS